MADTTLSNICISMSDCVSNSRDTCFSKRFVAKLVPNTSVRVKSILRFQGWFLIQKNC